MPAITNIIDFCRYLSNEEKSLKSIQNQKLVKIKCEFCIKEALQFLSLCIEDNQSVPKWRLYLLKMFRSVYNLVKHIHENNELAIKIFIEMIRLVFVADLIENVDNELLANVTMTVIYLIKALIRFLNETGRCKDSLAIMSLLPLIEKDFAENDYANSLITIWLGTNKNTQAGFGTSLVSCFALTKDLLRLDRQLVLSREHAIRLCDFELKAIVEMWPNNVLVDMIVGSYYAYVDQRLDVGKLIAIYVQILSVRKDIPVEWLRKWEMLVLRHFPDVHDRAMSDLLDGRDDVRSTSDSLNYALVLFCCFQLKIGSFQKHEIASIPSADYLIAFDNYASTGLLMFSTYLSTVGSAFERPYLHTSINSLLKSIIFECRFNEFVELELLAIKIHYQFNKLCNNTLEVLFIAGFLIEKLDIDSKLFEEVCNRVDSISDADNRSSNDRVDNRFSKLSKTYVLHFKMKLCSRWISDERIEKVAPLMDEITRVVYEDKLFVETAEYFITYLKYLNYLMYFLPCDQHPVYKPISDVLFYEIGKLFEKGYSPETMLIQRAMLIDILTGLFTKESRTELPHIVLLYYRFLEKVATAFKYRLMYEKAIYLAFLNLIRHANQTYCNSVYEQLIKLSHIDYKSIATNNDLDSLVSLTSSMQIDRTTTATTSTTTTTTLTDIESTSNFFGEISQRKHSLMETKLLFHNVHASILLWVYKTKSESPYLNKLFRIGIETYDMYTKSLQMLNCNDAHNYLTNSFLETYITFLYDYGTYFSSFKRYKTALKLFDKIIEMSPNSPLIVHVQTMRFFTHKVIEENAKK